MGSLNSNISDGMEMWINTGIDCMNSMAEFGMTESNFRAQSQGFHGGPLRNALVLVLEYLYAFHPRFNQHGAALIFDQSWHSSISARSYKIGKVAFVKPAHLAFRSNTCIFLSYTTYKSCDFHVPTGSLTSQGASGGNLRRGDAFDGF